MSSIETIAGRPISRLRFRGELAIAAYRILKDWYLTRRTRRDLRDLSDEALRDLGLTREAAVAEAVRPFWDTESRRKVRF